VTKMTLTRTIWPDYEKKFCNIWSLHLKTYLPVYFVMFMGVESSPTDDIIF